MSLTIKVLIGLTAGMIVGLVALYSGSPDMLNFARMIEPVGTLWVNAIRMTVIPLVAASIIAAFARAPDARTVGRVGGLSVTIFVIFLLCTAALMVVVIPMLLSRINPVGWPGLNSLERTVGLGAAATTTFPKFAQWFADLVPANPIRSAVEGAMLPLIVFCGAMGAAATQASPATRETLVQFFTTISDAMLKVMHWVLVLAPIGVFALAVPLATHVGLSVVGAAAIFIVLVIVLCLLVALILYPVAAIFGNVSLLKFAKACLPAQAVGMTTRSSLAALPTMMTSAEQDLGLEPALSRFYLPLAGSMFRVGAVIAQIAGVLFIARLYQVELSGLMLWSVALTSVITSFSVPGVAGGSIIVMVPVMMQARVPVEAIGLLLAIDTIPDVFRTALNITGQMTGAAILNRHAGTIVSRTGTVPSAA